MNLKLNSLLIVLVSIILAITISCNSGKNNSNVDNNSVNIEKKENLKQYNFEKEATITGTLQELTYTNGAGTSMKTYILSLDKTVNIISDSKDYETQNDVSEIQIGFSDNVKKPAAYLNKRITVKGTLYPSQTINDRRPATMIETEIIN